MTVATTGYNHRTWHQEMADAVLTAAAIYRAGDVMIADLKDKKAGRTHLDLMNQSQVEGLELVQAGAAILIAFDRKYEQILRSVADMGGLDQVAKQNDYHQN